MTREKTMGRARRTCVLAAWLLSATSGIAHGAETGAPSVLMQEAIDQAVAKIARGLAGQSFPEDGSRREVSNIAVLTIDGDETGYVRSALMAALAETHLRVHTRDANELLRIQREVHEYGKESRLLHIMDPNTMQRFGYVQGVDAVLYGRMWHQGTDLDDNRATARLMVHLGHVETGENVWSSQAVVGEAYRPWTDAVEKYWVYLAGGVGGLLAAVLLLTVVRRAVRPR
jgi:hypothetical protein